MISAIFVTLTIGLLIVLQGGLNQKFGDVWGLPGAVFVNAVVFLIGSVVFYLYSKSSLPLFEALSDKQSFSDFRWWYVLPGFFGLAFVIGVPYSIVKIGALNVFIVLIAAQIAGGFLWDRYVLGVTVNYWQFLAAFLALLSAVIIFLKGSPN